MFLVRYIYLTIHFEHLVVAHFEWHHTKAMLPRHIAFLPDGNRRWAKKHGVSRYAGHHRGLAIVLPRVIKASFKRGIHTVTVQPFSTENWSRPRAEISELMEIYSLMLDSLSTIASEHKARVVHLGKRDKLPIQLLAKLDSLSESSRHNQRHVINVALDYSGNDDILRAVKEMLNGDAASAGKLIGNGLNEWLDTKGQLYPNPDLIIRTAEKRLSGFMTYQAAYAELYFSAVLWPDFTTNCLEAALLDFSERIRNYGK